MKVFTLKEAREVLIKIKTIVGKKGKKLLCIGMSLTKVSLEGNPFKN